MVNHSIMSISNVRSICLVDLYFYGKNKGIKVI